MPKSILYYIGDPMCSWCWGFQPTFESIIEMLPPHIDVQYVMGGLAKDTGEPMPIDTQNYIKKQWESVTDKSSAKFNWDFWETCEPRRSTYPACRAVIAAGEQDPEALGDMFQAIQQAYYLEARNPSNSDTLISLAEDINLDVERFTRDLKSPEINEKLYQDFEIRRSLHADKFPTVILDHNQEALWLTYGYDDREIVLDTLEAALLS